MSLYCNDNLNENMAYMEILVSNYKTEKSNFTITTGIFETISPIDPFFKFMRFDSDRRKPIDICRISMIKPIYLTGFDETMILSEEEKDIFINLLTHKLNNYDGTMWDMGLDYINDYVFGNINWFIPINKLFIPNYSLLNTKKI